MRRTFITVAKQLTDDIDAVRMVTGRVTLTRTPDEQVRHDILTKHYDEDRRTVSPNRVKAVTDAMRTWLTSSGDATLGTDVPVPDVLPFGVQCSVS